LSAGLDMVSIPSGSFRMGSLADEPERRPNEGPQHNVTIASFFIAASPVTQAQWAAVVSAHPERIHRDLDPKSSFFRSIDLPVESITWYEAEEFCLRLAAITGRAYRLPSEAEWEYACRAGTVTPFNCGPTIGGSWSHNPAICRSAYRDGNDPSSSGWQGRIGLRVVCTL